MKLVQFTALQDRRLIKVNPAHVAVVMRPDEGDGTAIILASGVTLIVDDIYAEVASALEHS